MKSLHVLRMASVTILLAFFLLSGLLFCSDSESRVPFGQLATVVINLNLPAEHPTAMNDSIWNTIRRLFATDAVAQTAPATFSQINVRVTGTDMGAVEQQFSPYAQISMSVPAGSFRQVEVTAYVAPGDPSAALSFRGTAVANLPAGQTVSVPVVMTLNETKIVVPDFSVSRIVLLDSFNNPTPIPQGGTAIYGIDEPFGPHDIDFDARGRIYVTNTMLTHIIRMNSISGNIPGGTATAITTMDNPCAIAIDRVRNKIYYTRSDFTSLYRMDLDGTNSAALNVFDIGSIRGLDVDQSSGMLYMAGQYIGMFAVFRYDPVNESVVLPYYTIGPTPWDVMVRGDYVYVSQYTSPGGSVFRIPLSLEAGTALELTHKPGTADTFYGPHRFLAIQSRRIYIIDEDEGGSDSYNRLVSFTDISGADWSQYPAYPNSLFSFYADC